MNAQRVVSPSRHQRLDLVSLIDELGRADVLLVVVDVEVDALVNRMLARGQRSHGIGQSVNKDP